MGVIVFFQLQATEGNADEFLELLLQGREVGLAEPGCEAFDVHQGADDPHQLMIVERWRSPEEHQKHFEDNVVRSGMLDKAAPLMVQPPSPPIYYVLR